MAPPQRPARPSLPRAHTPSAHKHSLVRDPLRSSSPPSPAHLSPAISARRKAAYDALSGHTPSQETPRRSLSPTTTRKMSSDGTLYVGDTVKVPGGMTGAVRYIGAVNGKAGVFAGIELSPEFAQRGKNDGDVDGVQYFTTSTPGAGIFLPSHRATRVASPTLSSSSYPHTPETPSFAAFDLNTKQNAQANHHTPPTPSLPKFSQSVGPGTRPNFSKTLGHGARAPSPQSKLRPRPSLPRPGSPARTPSAQPAAAGGRPSAVAGFGASQRNGTAPNRALTASPAPARFAPVKPRTPAPVRSPSRSTSQLSNRSPTERSTAPAARFSNGVRGQSTSTVQSARSRDSGPGVSAADQAAAAQESERLQRSLDERDRQLNEQAASLAEMESSLAELQSLMAQSDELKGSRRHGPSGSEEQHAGGDVAQLRALLREKNEKISMLNSEFDGHRADFRSTIDTLEMASSETERVYEQRVQELLQEVQDLQDRGDDVESFAHQLKQLEDLVAELEEGLEDARRGEAEARSEVEFLRGEVERGRSELRRERDKAAKALKSASAGGVNGTSPPSRELEARDDEIRGLKAIIHSLSSGPDAAGSRTGEAAAAEEDLARLRSQTETLQREKGELQALVERKTSREEELERELSTLRATANRASTMTTTSTNSAMQNSRPQSTAKSFRSAHEHSDSMTSTQTAIRPSSLSRDSGPGPLDHAPALPVQRKSSSTPLGVVAAPSAASTDIETARGSSPSRDKRGDSSEFHDASETASNADISCDFCEQKGHDVLSCPNVSTSSTLLHPESGGKDDVPRPAPLRSLSSSQTLSAAPVKEQTKREADVKVPELGGDGPVAGKESRVIDMSKWCAMCEKDGHESVDCPFEDF